MDIHFFESQSAFHQYMQHHYATPTGFWVGFDKRPTPHKLLPEEALDIALCYGWIDGQIKSLDETYYVKYFAPRRPTSVWSTKNKKAVERLLQAGRLQPSGRAAIERSKKNGRWEKADALPDDFSMEHFCSLLLHDPLAATNYQAMSPSVQKIYAISYYALKKEESRARRLKVILERLRQNLRPME